LFSRSLYFHSAEKPRNLFERPLRCRQTDALDGSRSQRLQPFEGESEVRAALGGYERVNLVHDNRFNRAQRAGRARGEQQVERLGRGDENIGRLTRKAGTLALRSVAGTHVDIRFVNRNAHAASHVCDTHQRRAQIALNVNGERLERRNVNDATAAVGLPLRG